jgi:hypothetical protein
MVSTVERGKSLESARVMVRAFGSEPVELVVVTVGRGFVEVANPKDRTKTVGFPPGSVYHFNPELFGRLRATHARRQEAELAELWSEAEPYTDADR